MRKKRTKQSLSLLIAAAMVFQLCPITSWAQKEQEILPDDAVILSFEKLDEDIGTREVPFGTTLEELELPEVLEAVLGVSEEQGEEEDPEEENIPVSTASDGDEEEGKKDITLIHTEIAVSWDAEPEYDGNAVSTYCFTARPEDFSAGEDLILPRIYVTVEEEIENVEIEPVTKEVPEETMLRSAKAAAASGDILTYEGIRYKVLDSSTVEVTWAANSNKPYEGDIDIPESVRSGRKTYTVTGIGAVAFADSSITSVSIPATVSKIGNGAFTRSMDLLTVSFDKGNQCTEIPNDTFSGCNNLMTIELPDQLATIGRQAFMDCHNLGAIDFPDTLTSIGDSAFARCESIEEINIPEKLETLGTGAFDSLISCASFNVDTNNVHFTGDGGILFSYDKTKMINYPLNSGVDSYTIPDTVTEIGFGAFRGNNNLQSVMITDQVTTISGNAFYGCGNLSDINFGEESGLLEIGNYAFSYCTQLESVVIPKNVEKIGSYAFVNNPKLRKVTFLPMTAPANPDSYPNPSFPDRNKQPDLVLTYPYGASGYDGYPYYQLNMQKEPLIVQQQFNLTPGEIYWFDLSSHVLPEKKNPDLPDPALHWVPFTYAGTVQSYTAERSEVSADSTIDVGLRSLFLSDFNLSEEVSWNELDDLGLIFGDGNYAYEGVDYQLRSLSVGSKLNTAWTAAEPECNEWDSLAALGYIKAADGDYSWGQDLSQYGTAKRGARSTFGNNYKNYYKYYDTDTMLCFRPVLEVLDPDDLGMDGLKTAAIDFNGGQAGANNLAGTVEIVYTGSSFAAPAIDGIIPPQGAEQGVLFWKGDDGRTYLPGEQVPESVTELTAMYALEMITEYELKGIGIPAAGGTPAATIAETGQYTGTVSWSPKDGVFKNGVDYTAFIVLTPKSGYTLTGVPENSFHVEGALSAVNAAGSGQITAVFPATAEEETYRVNFRMNGGEPVPEQMVKKGGKVSAPETPLRSGYTFAGWFQDEALSTPYDFSAPVLQPVTIYAKWTRNQPPPVSNVGDSGSGDDSESWTEGAWKQDGTGWWYRYPDGTYPRNDFVWLLYNNQWNWYYFDKNGYMVTGWVTWNGNQYYLSPVSDGTKGHMVTGWHEIDQVWYYFNEKSDGTKGALQPNAERR